MTERLADVVRQVEEATLALTAALGPEHPRTLTARLRQAECDQLSGGPGIPDVRAETARLFGPDHPLTVSAMAVSGSGAGGASAADAPGERGFADRRSAAEPAFADRPANQPAAALSEASRARALGSSRPGAGSFPMNLSPAGSSGAEVFRAIASRTNHSGADVLRADDFGADVLRADDFGADLSDAGSAGAGASVAGSFAVGSAVAGQFVAGHYPAKSSETGAEVAARVLGRHHPLTVVMTAAARPEGDDPARAAAQAALVLGVGHSVTRMLDKRLRSCRRTGPNTPHPPTAPPTPSGPTPLP